MAFWGVEVKPGKPHCHQFSITHRRRLHITRATLGSSSSTEKIKVQCNVGDTAPIFLCCLFPDKYESCHMAFEFEEDEDVIFSVLGPGSVHLAGFYLDKSPGNVNNDDESDSYGEDIGETESDRCDDDEDEYEDDFIDDDVIMEYYPDSPKQKSGVVIEELLDDEEPAKVNGNRKRLKKKYQVSDSDGDAQEDIAKNNRGIIIIGSDDEEGLPLSSFLKINHQESYCVGNDQKQNIDKVGTSSFDLDKTEKCMPLVSVLNTKDGSMQEQSDMKEFVGDKINEAQDGGDQITAVKRTIEGCEIERSGSMQEQSDKKEFMGDKINEAQDGGDQITGSKRTIEGCEIIERSGSMQEQSDKKDFMRDNNNEAQDGGDQITGIGRAIEGCEIERGAGCVRHDSQEKPKKKKKKRPTESQVSRVENDLKVNVQEEEHFVDEARIDDTSKNELVKDQPVDNLYNDKAYVQSSNEYIVKTKKKHKKHAEEKKTTGLGNDSMVDVQAKNIQVKEAANNDFNQNQEVLVKDDVADKISIDKAFVQPSHENVVKTKKKHKKHAKDKQNTELGNNSMVDVQGENIQVKEAVTNDFNHEVLLKDTATDNITIDKEPGCIGHEGEKPKKKKKRGKESRNVVVETDSKIDVQESDNFKVKAQIDVISKNELIKDQANDNLSFDRTEEHEEERQVLNDNTMDVHQKNDFQVQEIESTDINLEDAFNETSIENVSNDNTKIHGKEAGEERDESMIDINQKDVVTNKAIENVSNDKGVEKTQAEIEIQEKEKPTKKRKKRTKVDDICDSHKEARPQIVKGTTDDITHEESILLIKKKEVPRVENSGKVKKKRKQDKEKQTSEAGDQSTINSQIDSIIVNQEA